MALTFDDDGVDVDAGELNLNDGEPQPTTQAPKAPTLDDAIKQLDGTTDAQDDGLADWLRDQQAKTARKRENPRVEALERELAAQREFSTKQAEWTQRSYQTLTQTLGELAGAIKATRAEAPQPTPFNEVVEAMKLSGQELSPVDQKLLGAIDAQNRSSEQRVSKLEQSIGSINNALQQLLSTTQQAQVQNNLSTVLSGVPEESRPQVGRLVRAVMAAEGLDAQAAYASVRGSIAAALRKGGKARDAAPRMDLGGSSGGAPPSLLKMLADANVEGETLTSLADKYDRIARGR